ncbi:hypothetical protein Hbl1158_06215 [Halobaculum sp. CBA1158]|uniref:hypothetical protein n=1 Tax=Halobaculum sp. CBA1158 TaxID=2904243 RepID=UPI001F1AC08B|nr:hypothetical protein [Halobaculum sp. CBA1158]UIP00949.1 hypothetical protein Hbl1158_06215 [Halobaculum sp. CBA1158]
MNPMVVSSIAVDGERQRPGEGFVYLFVELRAENRADELLNPPYRLGYTHDGSDYEVRTDSDHEAESLDDPSVDLYDNSGTFGVGATVDGWVYGAVPADAEWVTFVWEYTDFKADEETLEWEVRVPE